MKDEPSELERRLLADAAELDDAGSPEASIAAALLREAAGAMAECRRAFALWEIYHDVQNYVTYIGAIDATRAAVARLEAK